MSNYKKSFEVSKEPIHRTIERLQEKLNKDFYFNPDTVYKWECDRLAEIEDFLLRALEINVEKDDE